MFLWRDWSRSNERIRGTALGIHGGANNRYVVPVYQRKYDWKIDNCRQLYEDLKKVSQEDEAVVKDLLNQLRKTIDSEYNLAPVRDII